MTKIHTNFLNFLLILCISYYADAALDPECYMTVPEIARYFGYPAETHLVRTADDYILELHRISGGKNDSDYGEYEGNKPVVFMQHGLFADAYNYLPNLPSQSAATVFADAGFDVWLGNSRGTPCSQKHVGYGPEDQRFWNFSWQDMANYDITSSIDYVLRETRQENLYYIGHSQGTVIMFAKLADDPEFGKKIRQFHALAPVATVSHIGGLFKYLGSKLIDVVKYILYRLPNSPLMFPKLLQKLISTLCSLPIGQNVCTLDIGFVDGKEDQFNMTRVGVYLCHMPAATSTKDLLHWVQLVKSQRFQKFDFENVQQNRIAYGQDTPPAYDLSRIRTPTYIYWSKDDILADTEDIRETILDHMNKTIAGNLELPKYTHLDFVFGLNATKDLYLPMIEEMKKDHEKRITNSRDIKNFLLYNRT